MKNQNTKVILIPLLSLIMLVVLGVLGGKFLIEQISDLRRKIEVNQKDEAVLSQKLTTLKQLEKDPIISLSEKVVVALPSKHSGLVVMSILKKKAEEHGVILDNIKIDKQSKSQKSSFVDIDFDSEGSFEQISEFLKGVSDIAPIARIKKIQMNKFGEIFRTQTKVSAFWSTLPEKLPALNEPIIQLTADDKNTIDLLSKLENPEFIELAPGVPSDRSNPFSQ